MFHGIDILHAVIVAWIALFVFMILAAFVMIMQDTQIQNRDRKVIRTYRARRTRR